MDDKVINPIVAETGSKEKGYLLKFKEDGTYLTVYPYTDDRILFELTDITKLLHKNGIKNYGIELIAKTIREGKGEEIKIVNHVDGSTNTNNNTFSDISTTHNNVSVNPNPNNHTSDSSTNVSDSSTKNITDISNVSNKNIEEITSEPTITITVSKDKMTAALRIEMQADSKKPTINMIMDKINEIGIVFGIQEQAIKQAIQYGANDIVIAKGKAPVNGENASIIKKIDAAKQGQPENLENGKVDFKNLNLFIVVKEGELLAERIPPTPGIPGMDILGGVVAAKPGKTMMLPAGKNTKIVDEHKVVATTDGQVLVTGNKMSVTPTIEIKNDVDLSTGNIEFNGSVIVRGSVQAGFMIKAEGDVDVFGSISGGTVEARNITVKAGIQGMQRGYIKAREDIRSSFAENARIIAGHDIFISEAVLHSNLSAGKRIIVQGRRGVIAGGSAVAGEEILTKFAGTQMDTSTKLEVGINPMLRDEYQEARKALTKAQVTLDQAQKALNVLKATNPEQLSPTKKELLLRLTKSQFPLAGDVKKYKDRVLEIEAAFEELKAGKIKISDTAYPGVKIVVGSVIKHIRSTVQHSTFYEEDGEIKTGPF